MTYSFYLKPIIALGSFEAINNPKLFWMSNLFCSCHMPSHLMPRFGSKNVLILHTYLTRVPNIMIWFLSKIQDIEKLWIVYLFHLNLGLLNYIRSFLIMSKFEMFFYILHISSDMSKLTDYFMFKACWQQYEWWIVFSWKRFNIGKFVAGVEKELYFVWSLLSWKFIDVLHVFCRK